MPAALTLLFAVVMLLRPEDLRDRFIRLVGSGQIYVTTQAIDEASRRVSRYLLRQLLVNSVLAAYQPSELQPLIDDDVAASAAALAATLETSARGVIYEHRPASLPAERLMSTLKPLLAEAGSGRYRAEVPGGMYL